MNIKISIIMPVYNAGKYLSTAINSVLNQSFQEFELIIINDGSTDDSSAILNRYKENPQIVLVNQDNAGVSQTRNKGILLARGKYISFLDADDFLHPEYLNRLVSLAEKHNADIVVCENEIFYKMSQLLRIKVSEQTEFEQISQKYKWRAFSYAMQTGIGIPVGNKIYTKKLLLENEIVFDSKLTFGEDMFFAWKAFLSASDIIYVKAKLYFYRQTAYSATEKFHGHLYENYKYSFEELKNFAVVHDIKDCNLKYDLDYYFVKRLPSFLRMTIREHIGIKQKITRIKNIISDPVIKKFLQYELEQLVQNEHKVNKKIYRYAQKGSYCKLIAIGYYLNYRNKLTIHLKHILKNKSL